MPALYNNYCNIAIITKEPTCFGHSGCIDDLGSRVGGHGIEREVVERRYRESLGNLSRAVRICDEVIVLDNTLEFMEVARWNDGVLSWIGKLDRYGC